MSAPGNARRAQLVMVVTASMSVSFFRGQLAFLHRHGFDVDVVSSPGPELEATRMEGATPWAIPMEREISPLKDLVSLWRLWRLLLRLQPDLVVAGTPKAGLLGTMAARFAGVRRVVYVLHGLRLETATGWKRALLWATEWLACHAADEVRSVSPSLRARMVALGLTTLENCKVIGYGTSNGVDIEHWRRTPAALDVARQTREGLRIPRAAPLVGFVGRLTRDKGIADLYEAFLQLQPCYPNLRLLLVGDFETGDPVPTQLRAQIEANAAVTITGFVIDVAPYYWTMDVLALPTHREGFPGAPLEAQAASVPVVTTDATGAADAVVEGVTGLRVAVGDTRALAEALGRLLADPAMRTRLGQAGRKWTEENFQRERVWEGLLNSYRLLLRQSPNRQDAFGRRIKAIFDRATALVVLILAMPVWMAVAIAIRCSLGSPVLFRQSRPGLDGRPFTLLKFRTMREMNNKSDAPLADHLRLTRLGKLLRMLSADELPQLWNVLRGEMSLVGPRPLLMQYLDRYTPEQARRHEVPPGITGWAQVNGRNTIGWEEKFALDIWYVDHWSLFLDCMILARTLRNVIFCRDISSRDHATMPEFVGRER